MRRIAATLAVVGALLFSAGAAWADFDDGEAAYCSRITRAIETLAKQGDEVHQSLLGQIYEQGTGVPVNKVKAYMWYSLAKAQGNVLAEVQLEYIEKAMTPAQIAKAQVLTAEYYIGGGVSQNYAEAFKWYRRAVEQGFAEAQKNLGVMYARGTGMPVNNVKAHMWLSLAKAQGQKEAAIHLNITQKQMSPAQIAEAQKLAS